MTEIARDRRIETAQDVIRAYPRLVSHLICHSLGYCTPTSAAIIINDAHRRRENWCEWIASCYGCDPLPAVRHAIAGRHHHYGYMADYGHARAVVQRAIETGDEPLFASWF